jgi:hypothetical protein
MVGKTPMPTPTAIRVGDLAWEAGVASRCDAAF